MDYLLYWETVRVRDRKGILDFYGVVYSYVPTPSLSIVVLLLMLVDSKLVSSCGLAGQAGSFCRASRPATSDLPFPLRDRSSLKVMDGFSFSSIKEKIFRYSTTSAAVVFANSNDPQTPQKSQSAT